MFTGIITEIGKVKDIRRGALSICAPKLINDVVCGDSVAVNGVCLTVEKKEKDGFVASLLDETINRTNLKLLSKNNFVNLELAMKAGGRFGGHIVTGHVDCVARLQRLYRRGKDHVLEINVSKDIMRYIVEKGSITIDGVSLTVVKANRAFFTVHIIPFTKENTTLGAKRTTSRLNIEVDILARYVEKMNTLKK